jgi:hypothetical protein
MMLRSIFWGAVALLACVGAQAATVSHAGWFGFYLPWDDTSRNATDQSWSVEAPAGRHGSLNIGKDGHFHFADGTRARFAGYSTVAQANLPDSVDAPLIAAHLRRLGTNFLRLHLTDVDGIYGVFANSTRETRTLDVAKMRKLDWFMKCLRDNGIYYNLCVQAGRIFKDGDGISAPVTNTQSKYVTLFDPRLISLEKELARTLAEHVNAYTGIAYKNDPALATWEITNENQLFLGWLSWGFPNWDSATATNPEGMNGYYVRELDALWNRWLRTRYGSDSALSAAWAANGETGANLVQEPSFETGTKGWGWWADASDGAGIAVSRTQKALSGNYALSIRVDSQGTAAYKASVDYTGMSVAKGRSYRLRIWLKGSEPTTVRTEFLKESVWDWYGAHDCAVDTVWGLCEASFTAPADISDSLRFNIDVGLSKGTVLLDSADFRECSGDGLRTGESLEAATVRRSSKSTVGLLSPARAADEARFYYDVEGSYIAALKGYLKDSLGIAVPVTFTNNWYGLASLASQARGDYTEANWYWQHPSFPNGWSNTDYSIENTPMVKDAGGGKAAELTWSRVLGKPFVGTEYDHPFPSHYLCEAPALYFGHMGFLDADGALMFAYVDYEKERYKTTWTEQFFNNGTNPVFLTQSPLWRLFQTGAISPARSEAIVNVAEAEWTASARTYGAGWPRGANPRAFLATPMRWGRFDAGASDSLLLADPGTHSVSSTGELDWDRTAGVFKVDAPSWQGAVGYLHAGASTSMLSLEGIATTGGRDFAAIHLVSADSLPLARTRRMLLLTSARIENRSQVWNSTFTTLTTIYKAGDTTVCEPVTGTVKLSLGRDDSVSVYRLDARGNRMEALPVAFEDGRAVIVLPGTSLWYEVALGDATSAISRISFPSASGNSLRLRSGFGARLAWTSEKGGILEVCQYDVHGRLLWHFRRTVPAGSGEVALPRSGFCVVRTKLIAGAALERTFAATSW